MMKKLLFGLFLSAFCSVSTMASAPDEGMWLPLYLKQLNEGKMQQLGLKLSADDIYNINKSSLKDAVVSLGGFCTAEIVSEEGLLLTNHHCGYDAIKTNSTVQSDYLTDGFWAYKKTDELRVEGLFVRILVRMEEVTAQVNAGIAEGKTANAVAKEISETAKGDSNYATEVKPFMDKNQYFLLVYEVFNDIRLVGAPPEAIGKFGGDTDNWMWPRHTGDFSMLRIYAGADNAPAEYSPSNVPYKPKHVIPISLKGAEQGDFAMIMGFPGRTNRYLTASQIETNLEYFNSSIVNLFGARLEKWKEEMDADKGVRLQLASDYASGMNTYKYYIGQTLGLKKGGLVEKRKAEEAKFQAWANSNAGRKAKYGSVLTDIADINKQYGPANQLRLYYALGLMNNSIVGLGRGAEALTKETDKAKMAEAAAKMLENVDESFKETHLPSERKAFGALLNQFYNDIPKDQHPAILQTILSSTNGANNAEKFQNYANMLYEKSILSSPERMKAFLAKPNMKKLKKDPGYVYYTSVSPKMGEISKEMGPMGNNISNLRQTYVAGLMEMNPSQNFYPDANSTLRLTYGSVLPYAARDAVKYNHFTTLEGIMEKEDASNPEFVVPSKLKEIYKNKDYGQYADADGKIRIAFLSNNDITGGNSGSPIMNGNGELIGIAFDGNWEAMTGDIMFDNQVQRTISVDIRYVLLIIDKYAGATNLIDEMKIVR